MRQAAAPLEREPMSTPAPESESASVSGSAPESASASESAPDPFPSDPRTADGGLWLAASRVARAGGHILETLGHLRLDARDRSAASLARLRAERLQRMADRLCRVHGFDVRSSGKLPQGPVVLVANHQSYIDAPVLAALTPCAPIAKNELGGWPFLGGAARALGVLFVDRADAWSGARALRAALRSLARGVSVLGFPEGTTTSGSGELLAFRRGLFGVARIAGVPVVPAAIVYQSREAPWVGDQWFVPHYLRTARRTRTGITIALGAPIDPTSCHCAEDLAHLARSRIFQLVRGHS
jgi:1-acyl-sn-glycerol-3-phosphate acyltransferase